MITKLGTVISEYSVRNRDGENLPVYSVTNERGFCTGYFSKDVSSKDRTTYKIVPYGCFAYNPSRINVGSVDWQHCEDKVIVSPLYVVFKVEECLDQRYLLHYLKSDIAMTLIKANASGSVRDNLKFSALQEFPINLSSIEEQQEVADNLDKVDHLMRLYQQEMATLDDLVKSRFMELFGDPVSNPMGWPRKTLQQLVTVEPQNGLYKPQSDYVQDNSGVPILRIDAFYDGKVTSFENLKRLICSEDEKKRYLLRENDIVINRVNSLEYLGKCAHITGMLEDTVFESNMMRFHLDEEQTDAVFITHLLCSKYIYNQILRTAKKAVNQASINQKDVLGFEVYVPPLDMQQQFATFAAQVDKSKLAVQQGLQELETLKKSLMQQYFG